jgi:betaine-homocysteine S-methyltransferase
MDGKENFLARLEKGVFLVGEGYLFELERRGYLKAGPFVPEVVLKHPEAVRELHYEFQRAGSDAVVAFTYYGHRSKLRAVGKEGLLGELNRKALRLAREVARSTDTLLAGNLSNTWEYDPDDPKKSGEICRGMFREQVGWAKKAGADFIIAETFSHLGEAEIALQEIKAADLPAVITFIPVRDKSCDGRTWPDACQALEDQGAEVVGLNCGRGPDTMTPLLEDVRQAVGCRVAALPVPYRTDDEHRSFFDLKKADNGVAFPLALDPFLHDRFDMAGFAVRARDMGVDYLGLCCGGAPHHLRSMAEALGREVPGSEFSADMDLHPVFGKSAKQRHKLCWIGDEENKEEG